MSKVKFLGCVCMLAVLTGPASEVSGPSVASATSEGIQLDLAFTAKRAGVIFAGTVDSIGYAMSPAGETALTLVYFRDVVYAKGNPKPGTLVLTLRGGRTDRDWSMVVDQPEFAASKRYIVLAHADLGWEKISWTRGPFV